MTDGLVSLHCCWQMAGCCCRNSLSQLYGAEAELNVTLMASINRVRRPTEHKQADGATNEDARPLQNVSASAINDLLRWPQGGKTNTRAAD